MLYPSKCMTAVKINQANDNMNVSFIFRRLHVHNMSVLLWKSDICGMSWTPLLPFVLCNMTRTNEKKPPYCGNASRALLSSAQWRKLDCLCSSKPTSMTWFVHVSHFVLPLDLACSLTSLLESPQNVRHVDLCWNTFLSPQKRRDVS